MEWVKGLPSADNDSLYKKLNEAHNEGYDVGYWAGRRDYEQKWKPCSESERLPETEVLCCDTRGEMIIGIPYADEGSLTGYSADGDDVYMLSCVAWMPKPKPYEAERK